MTLFDGQVLAFAVVAAVVTVSPGADTLLVVRNALRGGRRDGMLTALGICSGLYVHAILSAVGVSAVLAHSAQAFHALRFGGAVYLAWLGLQSLRSGLRKAPVTQPRVPGDAVPPARSLREGLLTNLLNPKVIVFYLALLPQFVTPGGPVLVKSLLLAAIHCAEGLVWLSGVAWMVDRSRQFFLRPAMRRALDAICGTILVGLGVKLVLEQP